MNHDYAHCADYNTETCPETCFRGQLVRDYRERELGVPVSWMSFKDTTECKEYCRKQTNADLIRKMTDEELAELCSTIKRCYSQYPYSKAVWLEWMEQEANDG